jgi:hypothetical protein
MNGAMPSHEGDRFTLYLLSMRVAVTVLPTRIALWERQHGRTLEPREMRRLAEHAALRELQRVHARPGQAWRCELGIHTALVERTE